jgi:hypothetical protein
MHVQPKLWGCAGSLGRLLSLLCVLYKNDRITRVETPLCQGRPQGSTASKIPAWQALSAVRRLLRNLYHRKICPLIVTALPTLHATILVTQHSGYTCTHTSAHTQLDTYHSNHTDQGHSHQVKNRDECLQVGRLLKAKIGAPLLLLVCCTEYNGPTMQPLLSTRVLRHHV